MPLARIHHALRFCIPSKAATRTATAVLTIWEELHGILEITLNLTVGVHIPQKNFDDLTNRIETHIRILQKSLDDDHTNSNETRILQKSLDGDSTNSIETPRDTDRAVQKLR